MSCLEPPFWVLLVLAAILLPSLARADDFRLLPAVSQALQYNDNVFVTPNNKVHDFISNTTGSLELFDATEKLNLDVSAQLTQNLYENNTGLNSTDGLGNGSIRYTANPQLSLSGAGSYSRTSQPDQELLTTGLVLNGVTLDTSTYHGQADYSLTEKTLMSLSYDGLMQHYQSPRFADLTSDGGTLSLTRDLSAYLPQAKGLLNMSYTKYSLTGAEIENYEATTGFSYSLQEKWSIQVAAGLRRTDSSFETFVPTGFTIAEQTQSTSNWGGVGQASLSYKGEMTYASLTASRDITPASGQNGTVERTALTLSTDHRFSYDFHGSASTSFFTNKSGAGQFAAVPVNFVTFNIVPAVRYEFGRERPGGSQYLRDMFVEASYTFTRIEDKEADTNGNRSLFMIRFFAQHALLE